MNQDKVEPKPQVYCVGKNTGCGHEDKPTLKECSDCPYMTTMKPKLDETLTEQDIIPVPESEWEREKLGWHRIDESRLLTDEEIERLKEEAEVLFWFHKPHPRFEKEKHLLKAQDAKSASTKEAEILKLKQIIETTEQAALSLQNLVGFKKDFECQQRIKRIVRWVENGSDVTRNSKWQDFLKQEGIEW